MIQRIQSIYLLLVTMTSVGMIFTAPLWSLEGTNVLAWNLFSESSFVHMLVPILLICSAVLALCAIFSFKNRQRQFVVVRIIILIHLFLLGILTYLLLNLPRESASEKGIGIFVLISMILFSIMASKAIKRDEDLVKSVDRLR